MTQKEFHRLYEQMPEDYRAELIGGIVYEPSPLGWDHGRSQPYLNAALLAYAGRTPGLEVGENGTAILSNEDEVQPDLILRISPECGGQSGNTKPRPRRAGEPGVRYIKGAPELLAEIAHTSRAIDLHLKKERYRLAGVLEYVVVCLCPRRIYWFDLRNGTELNCGGDGIFRSVIFPGLWIDGEGILKPDYDKLMATVVAGMQTTEYQDFCAKLARFKR